MNVIEALFITLGFDTSDFDKKKEGVTTSLVKLGETSDKQTKAIAESGKKAANAFSMLKIEVLGALAAFGVSTGLKDFITTNMNGQAALGRLSANLGMSTQKLEAWKLAAKEMGQSGEDAVGALQSVASGVAEAKISGTSSLIQASRRFGFHVDTENPEQTLVNISRRMAETHDRQQALKIAEAAGVGNISNLLLQGPDKLQAQLAHTMSLTGAATKESTEQAARLQAQWADLQERFQQVGERVFNRLEPVLSRLGERLANWIDRIDWQKVIDGISRFIDKVNDVVKAMGGWKTIAEILGGVLTAKLLLSFTGIVAQIARLASLGGANSVVSGLGGAFSTLGTALAGINLTALASVVGALALLYSSKTGGVDKNGEQVEDFTKESSDAAKKLGGGGRLQPPKVTNNDLWSRVLGKQTAYTGSADQAALLLAHRAYSQDMSEETYQQFAADILKGKVRPGNGTLPAVLEPTADAPLGIRNNNPGNLRPGGSFATFATPQEGLDALSRQISLYYSGDSAAAGHRHLDTLQDIISTYAPSSENNTAAYIADLAKQLKVQPGQHLNLSDPSVMSALMKGIVSHENGQNPYSDAMINSAALKYARSVPLSTQTPAMSTAQRQVGNTDNSSAVTINGGITVNTKATDANGVVKGMQSALVRHPLMGDFTTGMS